MIVMLTLVTLLMIVLLMVAFYPVNDIRDSIVDYTSDVRRSTLYSVEVRDSRILRSVIRRINPYLNPIWIGDAVIQDTILEGAYVEGSHVRNCNIRCTGKLWIDDSTLENFTLETPWYGNIRGVHVWRDVP